MSASIFRQAIVLEVAAVAMALADAPLLSVCLPLLAVALIVGIAAATSFGTGSRKSPRQGAP